MNSSSRTQRVLLALACTALALAPIAPAFSQSGGGLDLRQNVIAGGGGSSGGGNLQIAGTAGQGAAGIQMSGGAFTQGGGVWPGGARVPGFALSLALHATARLVVGGGSR